MPRLHLDISGAISGANSGTKSDAKFGDISGDFAGLTRPDTDNPMPEVAGTVLRDGAEPQPFVGWIGLIAVLQATLASWEVSA